MAKKAANTGVKVDAVTSVAKMQLEITKKADLILATLPSFLSTVETVKQEIEAIKSNFAYNIEIVEIEAKEKIDLIQSKVEASQSEADEKAKALDVQLQEKMLAQKRELEKLQYDHSLVIRDKNLEMVKSVANDLDYSVVKSSEHTELTKKANKTEQEIVELVAKEVKAAEAKLHVEYGSKMSEIKNTKALSDMSLSKDIESLKAERTRLEADNAALKETIKEKDANIKFISEAATRPSVITQSK